MSDLRTHRVLGMLRSVRATVLAAVWGALAVDAAAQGSVATDRAALEALYDATDGANWSDSTNWKTSAPLDRWYGVTTDTDGRVTVLALSFNELNGSIPAELGSLENLRDLYLRGNGLSGSIPAELGNLANLQSLLLGGNRLSGSIPAELGGLMNLGLLSLNYNQELSGSIPAELGSLVNLRYLSLWGNQLSGPIPDALGNLANLTYLSLAWNALSGPIPGALGNLVNLTELGLSRNALSGPIPGALGNLANLERLDLSRNTLGGPIPDALGNLANLQHLDLSADGLTGPIPDSLGNLANLTYLRLRDNEFSGPVPDTLGDLVNLEHLDLAFTWGLSGPLPAALPHSRLGQLNIFLTRACAPAAWRDWLATIEFDGRLCEAPADVTVDIAVVYTPAARRATGGAAAIEAVIDLLVAETNEAYAASGVRHRLALVAREEVSYTESNDTILDFIRLVDPADGHLDEAHALRDRVGADLVHLIIDDDKAPIGGVALAPGAFGVSGHLGGTGVFAHETGHNFGLRHDRFLAQREGGMLPHPAYGYVNQRAFETGAAEPSRWRTMMSYPDQCLHARILCSQLLRFSNPRQRQGGDPLGVPFGVGSGVTGPADAVAVLEATAPAVALWRDRKRGAANRPPEPVGALAPLTMAVDAAPVTVDVSGAFRDPDGDALTYGARTSAPSVASVSVSGSTVTVTAVAAGTALLTVTATDARGSNTTAVQRFTVQVTTEAGSFTDHPIVPGVTPVRAVHFAELRTRIDALRTAAGLPRFAWTDPALRPGATRVRLVHLLELRRALAAAYAATGRASPGWTDAAPAAGAMPIRAAHLMELRAAVAALE